MFLFVACDQLDHCLPVLGEKGCCLGELGCMGQAKDVEL